MLEYAPLIAHQLDDADDVALVLDGHHHRRVRPCRAGLGKLLDRSLPVDVVVDAVGFGDALRDVVEEERFAADDHAALHAAALAVQWNRGQSRGIEDLALGPDVFGADEVVSLVVGRDDQAVVLDDVGEELVEALVDTLRLQALAELPRRVEEKLRELGFLLEFPIVHAMSVTSTRVGG